jgi:Flp pilus assembly pilin Flp
MQHRWLSAFPNFRPLGRFKTAGRRFLSNRSGTTAVEFAMIAVPFLGLIAAVFETGNVYFRTSQLQLTTETAGRNVLTHSLTTGITYQQFVDKYICTHNSDGSPKVAGNPAVLPGTLGTMFDCSKVRVDVAPAAWSSTYTSGFTQTAMSSAIPLPAAGTVAVVRIVYPVTAVAAILTGGAFKGQAIGVSRAGQTNTDVNNAGVWSYVIMGIYAFKVEP